MRKFFTRNRIAAALQTPHADEFIIEPMEPRLLLSADALGVDAGVLDREAAWRGQGYDVSGLAVDIATPEGRRRSSFAPPRTSTSSLSSLPSAAVSGSATRVSRRSPVLCAGSPVNGSMGSPVRLVVGAGPASVSTNCSRFAHTSTESPST